MTRMRLYIAGPISADTSRTVEEKIRAFTDAESLLVDAGYGAIAATEIVPNCGLSPDECSATTVYVDRVGQGRHSWECYLKYDLRAMLVCDGVALLQGWEMSPGARIEFMTAASVHLPVKSVKDWLDSAHGAR